MKFYASLFIFIALLASCGGSESELPCVKSSEICDGIDNNGNGVIDEGCICTLIIQGVISRGELFSPENNQFQIICKFAPQETETCGNGIDDNGNGQIDEGC